ncbi:MAG: microcystin degradation protein MlrC [Rhodobacteraceae bacterium]|nr:microcystin degradation protein MlrC [Paracoccaceae bacterium]
MRIAIAGFQHETNTFVAEPTSFADFERADSWPELLSGEKVISETEGMNLPIAGFIERAKEDADTTLLPILWCAAEPGGRVTDDAYNEVSGRILNALEQLGQIDAVYLDLHGAMVTQSLDDGEGELLRLIRERIGEDVPLVASLDMHANLTQDMVDYASVLTIYRTYPHIDMAVTGARAYSALKTVLAHGPFAKAWRQGDYMIPLHAQHTGGDPFRTLYAELSKLDVPDREFAEIALGFTAADIAETGPAVLSYSRRPSDAEELVLKLVRNLKKVEQDIDCSLLEPKDAVEQAIEISHSGPVVIADVQDNPGAGASSDTTGLLRALIQLDAPNTVLGLIHDIDLARQAHEAGEGACFDAEIGGRSPGDQPLKARVQVRKLSHGLVPYTGQMYGGGVATLGLSAALSVVGTEISFVVTSIRNQCLDLAQFHHFGLTPETSRLVCVKSTAHFRADFEPIAQDVLLAAAPGQFPCRLEDLTYSKLRNGIRRGPKLTDVVREQRA